VEDDWLKCSTAASRRKCFTSLLLGACQIPLYKSRVLVRGLRFSLFLKRPLHYTFKFEQAWSFSLGHSLHSPPRGDDGEWCCCCLRHTALQNPLWLIVKNVSDIETVNDSESVRHSQSMAFRFSWHAEPLESRLGMVDCP